MPTILSRPAPPPSTRLLQILAQLAEMPLLRRVHKPLGAALQLFPPRADLPPLAVAAALTRNRAASSCTFPLVTCIRSPAGALAFGLGMKKPPADSQTHWARRLSPVDWISFSSRSSGLFAPLPPAPSCGGSAHL